MKRILIAGGTGFLGTHLIDYLIHVGYSLSVLSRKSMEPKANLSYYYWNIIEGKIDLEAFNNVDTIINLTGANIGEKRWTAKRKKELFDSRIKSIQLLNQYVVENNIEIKHFISASATGYYEKKYTDKIFTEDDPSSKDFLGQLCYQWGKCGKDF